MQRVIDYFFDDITPRRRDETVYGMRYAQSWLPSRLSVALVDIKPISDPRFASYCNTTLDQRLHGNMQRVKLVAIATDAMCSLRRFLGVADFAE